MAFPLSLIGVHVGGPDEVREYLKALFLARFAGASTALILSIFDDVRSLFEGKFPGYQACDTHFHDFNHTCDATVAAVRIADGWAEMGAAPDLDARSFELLIVATLLHDSGYIKPAEDREGTGAKYTITHVQRSADFSGDFLPRYGFTLAEIQGVQLAIQCTGINVDLSKIDFASEHDRIIGCILGAGDLLGQMAAPDYPEKLPALYDEFVEAGIAAYTDATDLMTKTRGFYDSYVKRMLREQWGNMDKCLPHHFHRAGNPYLEAIDANLNRIDRMAAENRAARN